MTEVRGTASEVSIGDIHRRVSAGVVGREVEIELVIAAVSTGRDLVLEGPPGTSKTTLLKVITREWGIPLRLVEGNADLTPAKLVGHHNPARVLQEDYSVDNFIPGPLLEAMTHGGFLYLEEMNRAPDDTLNTLLTAMADRCITVPRYGVVHALPSFRVVASMNPFDNVGTSRLSVSMTDRLCRVAFAYQDAPSEQEITRRHADVVAAGAQHEVVDDAVALTRATRVHPDLRQGSSVRGAIDLALVATRLLELRGIDDGDRPAYEHAFADAMGVALSGRVHLDPSSERSVEEVLAELWADRFRRTPVGLTPD